MSSIQRIKVFEHEILRIGQQGFTKQHWEALLNYRKGSHEAYFQIIHQGIKFSSYVGIIQIGNLCIEILPKIDQHNQNHSLWQQVLIDMLRYCRLLKINQIGTATVNARFNSILELYLEVFLNEVRQLLQEGLIKSYSRKEENSLVLKGRLVVPKQMRHNQLSRERFYINYQKYDYNHPLNQIIRQGLNLILTLNTSPIIRQQALQIKAQFPTVNAPKRGIAAPILFHRTTERYRTAVEIAQLLRQNYAPDNTLGEHSAVALLFDMNLLWEEYIYRQLKLLQTPHFLVSRQEQQTFWKRKYLRPDILIRTPQQKIIIDTKWKTPENKTPSIEDLRQMYVYQQQFDAALGILLYPKTANALDVKPIAYNNQPFKCGISFINILKNQQLNPQLGSTLLQKLN